MEKSKGITVRLIWIPSHRGIVGNERADALASEAVRTGVDTQLGVPTGELRNLWKKHMYNELYQWSLNKAERRGSSYCKKFISDSRFVWFKNFDVNRRTITSINRLRSGHTSLRASLYRLRIVDSPMCLKCNVEETPDHVFWACEECRDQRRSLQENLIKARGYLPHCVDHLLATLDFNIIFCLNDFFCSINKFI